MPKPLFFISHIQEEKEIALALKKVIESSFLNMVEVFVSTDPESLRPGARWLETITNALKRCKVEIILASPRSIKRPWINFEGGAGWIRDISVIPLCHSGMTPSALPPPLNALQSAIANNVSSLSIVFGDLAKFIDCDVPLLNFKSFVDTVTAFEETSQKLLEIKASNPVEPTDGLSTHELAALGEIAEQVQTPDGFVPLFGVRDQLGKAGFTGVAIGLSLKSLERQGLILFARDSDDFNNWFDTIGVADAGWQWLEANQNKLILRRVKVAEGPYSEDSSSDRVDETDIPF